MPDHPFEAPSVADLVHLPVELVPSDDLGVVTVRAYAEDGDVVTLTWDTFARSFTVSWRGPAAERLRTERELATQISVSREREAVVLRCSSRGADFGGMLVVRVAEAVTVSDVTLQR